MLGIIFGPILAVLIAQGNRQDPPAPAPERSVARAEITSVSIGATQILAGKELEVTVTAIASRRIPAGAICVLFTEKSGGNFWLCKTDVVIKRKEESLYNFTLNVPEAAPAGFYTGAIQIADQRGNLIGEALDVATVEVIRP